MSSLSNKKFVITNKTKKMILDLVKLTENTPKAFVYCKEQILKVSFDLLKNILIVNNLESSSSEIKLYIAKINSNLFMIDFFLEMYLERKWISEKNLLDFTKKLEEISKMISVWSSGILNVKS